MDGGTGGLNYFYTPHFGDWVNTDMCTVAKASERKFTKKNPFLNCDSHLYPGLDFTMIVYLIM